MKWFDETGVRFVNSVPKGRFMQRFKDDEKIFAQSPRPGRLNRALVQAHMILNSGREGGLFMMIGQKT